MAMMLKCIGVTAAVFVVALAGAGGAYAQSGMVAAAHPLAIQEGERALQNGRNAIEAAVVTAAVLAVVEPYASGLGGGGYMVIHLGSGQDIAIDSNVTAGQATSPDMFKDANGVVFPSNEINSGGLAVGVPGALRHWDEALRISRTQLGGTMTLREALQPAIQLATDGFAASETFVAILERNRPRLEIFPATSAIFLPDPPLAVGSMLKQPDLARTLQMVADQGIDVFYRGTLAAAISQTVTNPDTVPNPPFTIHPGFIDASDLATYDIRTQDAVSGMYRGLKVVTAGPPSAGIMLLEMLNILEGFPLGSGTFGFQQGDTVQAMIETMKLSYADRNEYVGDPGFVMVPVRGLTSKGYADTRRGLIDAMLRTSLPVPQRPGDPFPFDGPAAMAGLATRGAGDELEVVAPEHSTTHMAVLDGNGTMVSYTTTLSELWGSAMVVPGFGFLLNNSLRNFTTNATGAGINDPGPGKRPRSFISPALVFNADNSPRLVVGSAGGATIPAIVLGMISGVLDHQTTIQEAIAAPRFFNRNRRTTTDHDTRYEPAPFDLPPLLLDDLGLRGQTMIQNTLPFGAAQGIAITPVTGTLSRGTDPRRAGEF